MATPRKKKAIKPAAKVGSPSIYTEELADRICDIIATHPVGYETIQRLHPGLPSHVTVRDWVNKKPEFSKKYLEARAAQADLRISAMDDLLPHELKTIVDDKGNERYDPASASMMIAKINNRKWEASKLMPKRYGKDIEEIKEMKSLLSKLIAGHSPELEKMRQENQKLKLELAKLKKKK